LWFVVYGSGQGVNGQAGEREVDNSCLWDGSACHVQLESCCWPSSPQFPVLGLCWGRDYLKVTQGLNFAGGRAWGTPCNKPYPGGLGALSEPVE
jgi:hypothetical protein